MCYWPQISGVPWVNQRIGGGGGDRVEKCVCIGVDLFSRLWGMIGAREQSDRAGARCGRGHPTIGTFS